ncbi:MAG: hypothetical protein KGZ53_02645 [Peptococcaceae bacterium]|nr:hypothetical protein [Peptococcaceae bacterium]
MTFLLLLSPTAPSNVRRLVAERGEVLYENIGRYNEDEVKKVFQAAARLPGDTLVLDIDISSGSGLVRAVHAFRISRPGTKIILLIGVRQPGDETISAMVSLGVYNICEPDNEELFAKDFEDCLRGDGRSYALAARWHRGFREDSEQTQRETVVIERRPVGRVTVAVAGMAPGIGCTHTALMLAAFLAKSGHAVALVEDSQRPVFSSIAGLATGKCKNERGFRLYGADIFPLPVRSEKEGHLYDQLLSLLAEYEYVVRDMGVLDACRLRELYRAGRGIAVTSASSWRVMDLVRQHNTLNEDFDKIAVVSAFGTDKDRKMFQEVTGIAPLPLAWCPDPSTLPEGGEATIKTILGSLLPERKARRAFRLF